ncbi:MAG: hypothetical protein EP343_19785 [Deltaproteobacteria bacterium]|nr:MAG: hypothetical protein EP343_19785 [Deltaproteobacteria bacterium]
MPCERQNPSHQDHRPPRRRPIVLLSLTWLFGLTLLVHCSPNQFQEIPASCTTSADCPGSQTCESSRCKTPLPSDCKQGDVRDCYTGAEGTKFVGICKPGTQTCTANNAWPTACTGETVPAPKEICGNNQDDDCDGKGDDKDEDCQGCEKGQTKECYTGPAGTKNIGACSAGKQTCKDDNTWGPCEGEVLPKDKEVCGNLTDDDCNGKSDLEETACGDCQEGDTKPCYEGPQGSQDVGICKAGKQTCTKEQKWGPCENQVKPLSNEICNNQIDDDCNGTADDGPCLTACTQPSECTSNSEICYIQAGQKSGFCVKPCINKSTCRNGQDCLPIGPGQPNYCLPVGVDNKCDPSQYVTCAPESYCDNSGQTCQTPSTAALDKPCNNTSLRCSGNNVCVFLPTQGVCKKKCQNAADCTGGTICADYIDARSITTKVCLKECSPSTTGTCDAGETCIRYNDSNKGYCTLEGTVEVWGICQFGGNNCKPGLRCFIPHQISTQRPVGYCVPGTCNSQNLCPRITGVAGNPTACTKDIKYNYNNCLLPCQGKPNLCDNLPGFSCRAIGGAPPICLP